MDRDKRLGTILIGVGILALLGRAGLLEGAGTLFVLSAVALAIYAFSGGHRKYSNIASLIPGLVLVAIGISIYLEQRFNISDGAILFWLSAAFLGIYLIHTRIAGSDWGSRYWPLFPGCGLLIIGFLDNPDILGNYTYLLAVGLILGGLYLIRKP